MTANDPQEAVLLMLGCFFLSMALWCGLEWLFLRVPRRWRCLRWQRRIRAYQMSVDRSKNALRSTVRPV